MPANPDPPDHRGPVPPGLPTPAEVTRDIERMLAFGSRLPGTPGHDAFVDWLDAEFTEAGLRVTRDRFAFERWTARKWSLEIHDGTATRRVPISAPYTQSRSTPPEGITAPLVYTGLAPGPDLPGNLLDVHGVASALGRAARDLGSALAATLASIPGGVRGRIVVVDAPVPPFPTGLFDLLRTDRHDPEHTIRRADDYKRVWTAMLTLPTLERLRDAGAVGAVFVLDASAPNAAGQYLPFIRPAQDLPALIVDRETGRRLRRLARTRPTARMLLDAETVTAMSDSLVAELPGARDDAEVAVVHTHTDGMNAFEENGALASRVLARRLAAKPRSERRRSHVFSCVTGHFGPDLPETVGFVEGHPDLIRRAAVALTLEHLGALEWLDDRHGYHPTGRAELAAIFHSPTPVAGVAARALRAVDLRRTQLLRPIRGTFFGVGAELHAAGIPSVAYIPGPNYLLASADNGHLDKLDPARMAREIAWAAELLDRLEGDSAATLADGMTTAHPARPVPGSKQAGSKRTGSRRTGSRQAGWWRERP
ncbi:hypothetical protein [Streptomyces sp. SID3343]|uniref:hypothetical protein n=1 Tax=Streptomyces sp. SID3343 TaxID=2690260 RepID=UPI00136AEEAB|nr:hypothetical protein [Streptomyces sp. SID3343]MYW04827.1 hypothetical protein [Streptomyces sp. SID3343]